MHQRVDQLIGSTPIVELTRLQIPDGVRIFAKIEFLNPGGSIKDRIVRHILSDAKERGNLTRGSVVIENTSGNTGAAIAMLAPVFGYKAVLTMPDKVSREKQDALRAWVPKSSFAQHRFCLTRRITTCPRRAGSTPRRRVRSCFSSTTIL